jgi:hypothetical protein
MAPVTIAEAGGAPGKLFLTSRRMVLVSAGVSALPWHRVRELARSGRSLVAGAGGDAAVIAAQCNSFADALVAHHLASRLAAQARAR